MRCGVVIPAAGGSQRMGDVDKTCLELAGRPVLEWVLRAIEQAECCQEIVLVTGEQNEERLRAIVHGRDRALPVRVCRGGSTRQASVANGVACLDDTVELVLIHDLARALVRAETIREGVALATEWGAAVAAVPVVDTIKIVAASGVIEATPPRDRLWAAQTPQIFRRDWLRDAYARVASADAATDEATLVERAGYPVRVYPGDPENIKLTTPTDIIVAESLLHARANGSS